MTESLFLGHLGMGDHLICNALVRAHAETQKLVVIAKQHNVESCRFMWRDNKNINVFGVENDNEANEAAEMIESNSFKVIRQGCHRKDAEFTIDNWDRKFYEEAGFKYGLRWSGFKVDRQPSREIGVVEKGGNMVPVVGGKLPKKKFILVHEDVKRGCIIRESLLPKGKPVIRVSPMTGMDESPPNIFDWWGLIMAADELHFMESCFAILADHSPELRAKKKCLHIYTRKSVAPAYNTDWTIIA